MVRQASTSSWALAIGGVGARTDATINEIRLPTYNKDATLSRDSSFNKESKDEPPE